MGSTKPEALQTPTTTGTGANKNGTTTTTNKSYGKIILTLKNQLLPEEKLVATPSQLDGLDSETETDLRIYGCELIQTAGILLKLPQVAMATGQVLLQRFYYSKSLVRHPVEHTAMACVCLASKIEEAPRRARDVINVFTHIRQVESNKPITPVILDQNYIQLKNQVIKAERRVLKELGFCVHIKHPHKIIVMYLQVLCLEKNAHLMQYSWNYMNDSLRTDVFVRYQPETVACACIYLTARKLKLPLPKNPAWYKMFGVQERQIRDICVRILKLYDRPKANVDSLERKVDDLCKRYQEAKIRARGYSSGGGVGSANTPPTNNNSPNSPNSAAASSAKTTGAHNAWGGFISRSGSHVAPAVINNNSGSGAQYENNGKRSRSPRSRSPDSPTTATTMGAGGKSPTNNTTSRSHHKKKRHHRSRSRSPVPRRKSFKRRTSFSRSMSQSPPPQKSRKNRDKRKSSRSPSYERSESRYDKYDKYRDEVSSSKDRYDDGKRDRYESSKKYDRDEKSRYSSSGGGERRRSGKHGRNDDEKDYEHRKDDQRSNKDRRR